MHLDMIPVIDSRMTTATTDGARMFMDAEFYSKMDEEERLGIIGHEVWHCALRHFQRLGNRDRKKFNFACDVEVDLLLHRDGFKVEVLPHEATWEGKSAEQIYDLMFPGLEQFQKDDEHIFDSDKLPGDDDGEKSGDESDDGGDFNEEDHNGKDGKDQDAQAGNENGGISGRKVITGDANLPFVSHDGVIDPDFQPAREEELAEDWKDHLKNAVQQEMEKGGKGIGNLPGNVEDLIKDENKVATVDWKKVLLDYVSQLFGGDRQWLPPARRYVWKKLYLPSRAKKQSIEIVLAIDTSGSTTEELPNFLVELRGMASAFGEYKITIIQCDIAIHSVQEYSNDDPLPEAGLQFKGFGGTSFLAPFQYVEEKMDEAPTVFIYLTDGFGEAPSEAPDYPVIWCLTQGGVKPADWGLEVKIEKK
jgi:predicted metal-dependent peptidase